MRNWGLFLLLVFLALFQSKVVNGYEGFITRKGVNFLLNGSVFYANGFNAYWLMYEASFPWMRPIISRTFQNAVNVGLTIARIWAFRDGVNADRPLQYYPGNYSEDMFQALDFVVNEAKQNGIKLILSMVNNWSEYGGKPQYVEWGKFTGQPLSSQDDFFTNSVVKGFYKDHVKTVLTRVNSISGVAYKDDPTIMAWELINEPQCRSDLSGKTLESWISEMAWYLKSIESNHLLEVGLEGYYGASTPERIAINPESFQVGTDFIAHNQIPGVDFTTIHTYPWLGDGNASWEAQFPFMNDWVKQHIEDSQNILQKPIIIAEWGKNKKDQDYSVTKRDELYRMIYTAIYSSASDSGCAAGGLFWQLMTEGMDSMSDGLEISLTEGSSTVAIIFEESHKLATIGKS